MFPIGNHDGLIESELTRNFPSLNTPKRPSTVLLPLRPHPHTTFYINLLLNFAVPIHTVTQLFFILFFILPTTPTSQEQYKIREEGGKPTISLSVCGVVQQFFLPATARRSGTFSSPLHFSVCVQVCPTSLRWCAV